MFELFFLQEKGWVKRQEQMIDKKTVPNVERNQLTKGLKSPQLTTRINKRGQHGDGSLLPLGMLHLRA